MRKRCFLTFPQQTLGEPLIATLVKEYGVVPNIRGAMVTAEQGLMAIEFEGPDEALGRALAWLRARGVQVEEGVPEGVPDPGLPGPAA
jgi:ABC-type methionine transport system ATPase subunit